MAEETVRDEHFDQLTLVQEVWVHPVLFIMVHTEAEEHSQ